MAKEKVVVAMSGGVDSSVTAVLLQEQGYDVIGMTMRLYAPEDPTEEANLIGGCCSLDSVDDARRVCEKLGIPFYAVNYTKQFEQLVIRYFQEEYLKGRTPNPCVACNIHMKYDLLLNQALELGARYLATGHYAKRWYDEKLDRYILAQAKDPQKDQSYVLCNLTQHQLKHSIFPLGDYLKTEIRDLAKNYDLRVHNKPDSQEICFIPNNDYKSFIEKRTGKDIEAGYFYDTSGNVIGKHRGLAYYTVGQRKGLGLALGYPAYVTEIIPEKNIVIIGTNEDVFDIGLYAEKLNWIAITGLSHEEKHTVYVKIRSTAKPAKATIVFDESQERLEVIFDNPERAATPGQIIAFYDEQGIVLGGGVISKRIRKDSYHES